MTTPVRRHSILVPRPRGSGAQRRGLEVLRSIVSPECQLGRLGGRSEAEALAPPAVHRWASGPHGETALSKLGGELASLRSSPPYGPSLFRAAHSYAWTVAWLEAGCLLHGPGLTAPSRGPTRHRSGHHSSTSPPGLVGAKAVPALTGVEPGMNPASSAEAALELSQPPM